MCNPYHSLRRPWRSCISDPSLLPRDSRPYKYISFRWSQEAPRQEEHRGSGSRRVYWYAEEKRVVSARNVQSNLGYSTSTGFTHCPPHPHNVLHIFPSAAQPHPPMPPPLSWQRPPRHPHGLRRVSHVGSTSACPASSSSRAKRLCGGFQTAGGGGGAVE